MADLKLKFKMPDDESLANYISIKGEKGEPGDPTKLSQLENDTGFITASTSSLANYYTKTETDDAIDNAIENLPIATTSSLGTVKIGDGLDIDLNGELSVATSETANYVFRTVTEMRGADLAIGQRVSTLGYYSEGDGGGADYLIRAKETSDVATNYDNIILSATLVAQFVNRKMDYVNPLQFGAKGDGVTDDSAIISYALKYKKLRITKKHRIATQITAANMWEVTISGERRSSDNNYAELDFDTGNDYGLIIGGYCLLENLIIKGEKCIKLYQWNNTIRNNRFIGNSESSTDVAIKFGSDRAWFGENVIENNTFNKFNIAIDCYTETSVASDEYINNNIVILCDYFIKGVFGATFITENHDYSYHGILLYGNDNMIDNNYFDNKGNTSIRIKQFGSSLSISGNFFLVPATAEAESTDCIVIEGVANGELTTGLICCNNHTGGKTEDVTLVNFSYVTVYGTYTGNKAPTLFRQVNYPAVLHSSGLVAHPKGNAYPIGSPTPQRIKAQGGIIHLELSIASGTYSAGEFFTHNWTRIEKDYYFTFYHSDGIGTGKFGQDGKIYLLTPSTFTDPIIDCDIDCRFTDTNYNTFS